MLKNKKHSHNHKVLDKHITLYYTASDKNKGKTMNIKTRIVTIASVLITIVLGWIGFETFRKPVVNIHKPSVIEKPVADPVQEKTDLLIKQLLEAVSSKNAGKVSSLMQSLSEIGPAAIQPIVTAFNQNTNPEIRIILVRTLGKIRDQATINALLELHQAGIAKKLPVSVRKEILVNLSVVGGRAFFDNFIDFLKAENDPELRKIICDCITALGDVPKIDAAIKANLDNPALVQDLTAIKAKMKEKDVIRDEYIEMEHLDLSNDEDIKKLEQILNSDKAPALRIQAVRKLEKANSEKAVNVLLSYIESTEWATNNDKTIVKPNALMTLARMRTNESRLAVNRILKNGDFEIRKLMVKFIGDFGDKAYIPVLNQVITDDASQEVKNSAQGALATLKRRNP